MLLYNLYICPISKQVCTLFIKIRYFENNCSLAYAENNPCSVICIVYTVVIAYYTFQSISWGFKMVHRKVASDRLRSHTVQS